MNYRKIVVNVILSIIALHLLFFVFLGFLWFLS